MPLPGLHPSGVPIVIGADGRFSIGHGDLMPQAYVMRQETSLRSGTRWSVEQATADGRDILDHPLELAPSSPAVTNVMLTLTDRPSSLSGVLQDQDGRPTLDYTVVVFSTDRSTWSSPYRRVRGARPGTDGRYLVEDLPPGEYFLAACGEVDAAQLHDAGFLDQLVPAAVRISIRARASEVQDLRVAVK